MYASSTSLKSRAARPMKKFDSPGETPQSTTAVEPRSRARASSWSGSSREKEMSARGFPASLPERRIVEPSAPGRAPTTQPARERLGGGGRGGGERSGGGAGFGRAGGSPDSSPATKVGGLSRTSGEAARRSQGPRLGCDPRDSFDEPRLCNGTLDAPERAA